MARFLFAGLPIEVRAAHPGAIDDLAPIYQAFATTEAPRLTVTVSRVDGFDRERAPEYPAFQRRALPDGRLHVERFDAEGEVDVGELPLTAQFRVGPSANSLEACLRIAASLALPRDGALFLHSSAVVHAGRALVFSGVSGAGKSTISALLADAYPSCTKIADELLVIRATAAGWQVVVPPYLGPAGIAHGASAPLAGVHFLAQAPFDRRDPLTPAAALPELLRHVLVYVAEPGTAERVLDLAATVTATTPCYRLHFRKDPHVGTVLEIAAPPADLTPS
ncbi:MAG: hypothetical protein IPL61_24830 [Myxococcales bacterium]|nr:hypothetical protein [Myxococcales bacterium]